MPCEKLSLICMQKGVSLVENPLTIIITVAANVISNIFAYYICKWLDKK